MRNLVGKVAVITGGNDGIGKQIAIKLAEKGVKLALVARNEDKLKQAKDDIDSEDVHIYPCDIGDADQRKKARDSIVTDLDHVDILINNAGIIHRKQSLEEIEEEYIDEMMATNLTGLIQWTKLLLPNIKKCPESIIINVSSSAGVYSPKGLSVYAATKWGVRGFSNVLRQDLKGTVRVSCLCQAGTNTGLFAKANDTERALEKYTDPADLADVVVFMIRQPDKCLLTEVHVDH